MMDADEQWVVRGGRGGRGREGNKVGKGGKVGRKREERNGREQVEINERRKGRGIQSTKT